MCESLKQLKEETEKFLNIALSRTSDTSPTDLNEIINKFQAYRIELEHQNEKLSENKTLLEKALIESESNYRTLANSGQTLIWTSDIDKLCKYFNDVWLNFTGRTLEEEYGNGWAEGVHPDDLERCVSIYVTAFDKRENFSMEYRLRHHSGEYRWLLDEGAPRYNSKGDFAGYLGHCFDITERKITELSLLESEERFREVLENSIDASYKRNLLTGTYDYLSPVFENISGYTAEEFSSFSLERVLSLMHLDDISETNRVVSAALTGKGNPCYSEYRLMHKDGQYRWIHDKFNVLRNETGVAIALIGSVSDITERKIAELALKESEEQFLQAFENSAIGTCLLAADKKFLKFNTSLKNMLGYSDEEIVNLTFIDITHPDDHNIGLSILLKLLAGEIAVATFEKRYIKKDGSIIWASVSTSVIKSSDRQPFFITQIIDITESKKAAEEIKLKNEQLVKLISEKDKFFSIIAHDLKSPFNGFLGLSDLLARNAVNLPPEDLTLLGKQMHASAENLFELLKNLLEWSQMQRGLILFAPSSVSLSNIISNNFAASSVRSSQKGISMISKVGEQVKVSADINMINSILLNLISNAVKFTGKDGTITCGAKLLKNHMVEISIKDTGVGIAKDKIEKLFSIGEKIGTRGTEGELSTGLGLLLCKEFVEKHGGKIWVESEEGKGSTFYFTLPKVSHE